MTDEEIKALAKYVATTLLPDATDEQRTAFFYELGGYFCDECGRKQDADGRRCQCWNDE